MQINIIEQISNSCSCSHMEAQEYLDSEIRYLRELPRRGINTYSYGLFS